MPLVLDDLLRDPDRLLQHLRRMTEVITQQKASLVSLQAKHDTVLAERDAVRTECQVVRTERDLIREEHEAAQAEVEKLRLLIRQLQRGQFGRRSEKLDPDQLQLGLEDLEQTVAAAEAAQETAATRSGTPRPARTERRRNLGALPAHLPRLEVLVDIEDKSCPCCGGGPSVIHRGPRARVDISPGHPPGQAMPRPPSSRPAFAAAGGEGGPAPAPRLPGLRGGGGAGAPAGGADHGRDGNRGTARARAGGQIL